MENKKLFFHKEVRKYIDFLKELDNDKYLTKEGKRRLRKFTITIMANTITKLTLWRLGGR